MGRSETEEIGHFRDHDGERDPRRESAGHRPRDVLDEGTKSGQSHKNLHRAGHEGGHDKSDVAVLGNNQQDQRHESGRGAADLHPRSSHEGNNQPPDDRRDHTECGCRYRRYRAGGDAGDPQGKSHGKGNKADGNACQQLITQGIFRRATSSQFQNFRIKWK